MGLVRLEGEGRLAPPSLATLQRRVFTNSMAEAVVDTSPAIGTQTQTPRKSVLVRTQSAGEIEVPPVEAVREHRIRNWAKPGELKRLLQLLSHVARNEQGFTEEEVRGWRPRLLIEHFGGNTQALQARVTEIDYHPENKTFTSRHFPGETFTRTQLSDAVEDQRTAVSTSGIGDHVPSGIAFVNGMGNIKMREIAAQKGFSSDTEEDHTPLAVSDDDAEFDDLKP